MRMPVRYPQARASQDGKGQGRALFGRVMLLVAVATALFTLGCYSGRVLAPAWTAAWFIIGVGCLIAMHFTARGARGASVALLLAVGLSFGLAMGSAVAHYSGTGPTAIWRAAGATAMFVAAFGTFGYATSNDLTAVGRTAFFGVAGLIVFGMILIFTKMRGLDLLYSVLGLVVFAGLTLWDCQRLRRTRGLDSAPLLAASIFLDAMNVFGFFARRFAGRGLASSHVVRVVQSGHEHHGPRAESADCPRPGACPGRRDGHRDQKRAPHSGDPALRTRRGGGLPVPHRPDGQGRDGSDLPRRSDVR